MRQPSDSSALKTGVLHGLAVILCACGSLVPGDGENRPTSHVDFHGIPKARSLEEWGANLPGHDWDEPLNVTEWRDARRADHMNTDDVILGLSWEGKAWAVPWWIMKNHHVANLTLGSRPVLITFCEFCSSGAAFSPMVEGRRLKYHLVGVYNGSNLIGDYETKSIWAPFSGNGLYGPLKGATLERLPLFQCTWAEWLALHPESVVAFGVQKLRRGHGAGQFPGKANHAKDILSTLLRSPDPRLPMEALILGVRSGGRARAYPLSVLDRIGPTLDDTIGHSEIVIFHLPGSILASAFSRRLGDDVLQFDSRPDGRVVDEESGSIWNLTGEAASGRRTGQRLTFVFSGIEEWYIWAAYNPNTEIAKSEPRIMSKSDWTGPSSVAKPTRGERLSDWQPVTASRRAGPPTSLTPKDPSFR